MDWQKYIFTFILTASVFAGVIALTNYFDSKRVVTIESIQRSITSDLQANEIQYELLSELSCREVSADILSRQISEVGRKIEFTEQNLGVKSAEIIELKKQYSLLQAKDYILMKRINERCGKKFMFAFYFYGNEEDCSECARVSIALSELKKSYPDLRVYSFDYNLDAATVRTIIQIFGINKTLPAIVIGDKAHYGAQTVDTLEGILKKTYPREIAALEAEKKQAEEEKLKQEAEAKEAEEKKSEIQK